MKKRLILSTISITVIVIFFITSCATGFQKSMNGVVDYSKFPEKIASIKETRQYWSFLFLNSPSSMRQDLAERTLEKARDMYGKDVDLINLEFTGEWNGLSLLLYFNMLGQVQDVTLQADIVRYVEKEKITDDEKTDIVYWESDLIKANDEFNNVIFTKSNFLNQEKSRIQIYYVEKEELTWLRLKSFYKGADWIFYDKLQFVNNENERVTIDIDYFNKKTEVLSGGDVWEYSDIPLSDKEGESLKKIFESSSSVKVRFSGKYNNDILIDSDKSYALLNILNAYYKNL